jgi:hypothetical protein
MAFNLFRLLFSPPSALPMRQVECSSLQVTYAYVDIALLAKTVRNYVQNVFRVLE